MASCSDHTLLGKRQNEPSFFVMTLLLSSFFDRVDFFPEMGETHRGGKVATRVACFCNGKEVGKLFYKPRDAIIDASVIQLFQDINNLPQDEQHPRPSLPTYKIMNCQSHDGTPASIWEYIEGAS